MVRQVVKMAWGGGGGWGRGEPEELGVRTKTILYVSTLEKSLHVYTLVHFDEKP